jgi:demethylmenaquinone methyltransferase/2-methoxy-6-polyprenyl-1,4-benzoquinol methylase
VTTPYNSSIRSKKKQVEEMFDNIAWRYDFLNHFLSLGIDRRWRRKAIRLLKPKAPSTILDVATGTGDFAIEAMTLDPVSIVGVDLSREMLEIGRTKVKRRKLENTIRLEEGDAENLSFEDRSFDALTVAFGVRNFESLEGGLKEMFRVLKTDGTGVILEFSLPQKAWIRKMYFLYFRRILPAFGRWFSKDSHAYTYLPDSVNTFPDRKEFISLMESVGFTEIICKDLTFGIASIFVGQKNPADNKL